MDRGPHAPKREPRPPVPAREAAVKVVRVLRDAGHVAYLAGGCVRDTLLGLTPQDYDAATDARPERVRELFRHARYVGEAFGVVLVRLLGHEVEVATFRLEWGYEDGRRPTRVEFTDAEHDARRRDFTVNGLFEDPLHPSPRVEERVIDFVGGREDLRGGLIRAIGEPAERFGEDYLRMLRAVRFAARLGFSIEERTAGAIRGDARRLGRISRERIGQEIAAMLAPPAAPPAPPAGGRRARAARLMQDLHLDAPALDEEHAAAALPLLEGLAPAASYPAALAAWMLDRRLPPAPAAPASEAVAALRARVGAFVETELDATLRRWRQALCLSNETRDAVRAALVLLPAALNWPELTGAARKRALASAGWGDAFDLLRSAGGSEPAAAELARRIDAEAAPLRAEGVAPAPWVSGDDLIELGRKPGPAFRRLLEAAYEAQLEGRVRSRDEARAWLRERAERER